MVKDDEYVSISFILHHECQFFEAVGSTWIPPIWRISAGAVMLSLRFRGNARKEYPDPDRSLKKV